MPAFTERGYLLTPICFWLFAFLLARPHRDQGPSLPSPCSFRTDLGLPAGPLPDFSRPDWVSQTHGMEVSSTGGTPVVAPSQAQMC